jgi:uncharacterized repeat protein (TIGR04052 family)
MRLISRFVLRTLVSVGALGAIPLPSFAHAAPLIPVSIRFQARVLGAAFNCQQTYQGLGLKKSMLKPKDFRFYVSQVALINSQGQAVPLKLKQDGLWQYQDVALLDFEDKTGSCTSGTTELHTQIEGQIPAGTYRGLSFELGVPFELNHQDVSQAESPLNMTSLFWVWRSGYKFARIDFSTTGLPQGFFIHLGSTGCSGSDPKAAPSLQCTEPNRAKIFLPDFEPSRHQVIADLGRWLAESDLDSNQPQTAAGCMAEPNDNDCQPLFSRLGLPFAGLPGVSQQFFFQE